jgi:hypothetical protein
MRMQFFPYVGLLGIAVAGGLTGCDNIDAGHGSDPSGPVKLVRLMVQDSTPNEGVGFAIDLLDTPGSPLTTSTMCDETHPCLPQFTLGGNNPDFTCNAQTGMCNDPINANQLVQITPPVVGVAGEDGGDQIRFVFSKLLNNQIETVTINPAKLPGSNEKYALAKGLVELDGPDGMPVPSADAYWDPAGSPINTSDPILNMFGPAVVFKPGNYLAPNATYTVKILQPSMFVDRTGQPLADQNGVMISSSFSTTFKTVNMAMMAATPDVTTAGAMIAPDDVIQFQFNTGALDFIPPAMNQPLVISATATATSGQQSVPVLVWADRGGDPKMCAASQNDLVLNVFPVDQNTDPTTSKPLAAWPTDPKTMMATYTITLKVASDDQYGKGSFDSTAGGAAAWSFSVSGAAGGAMDGQSVVNHVLPSQCM